MCHVAGERVPTERVKAKVHDLNIQVDNLCQVTAGVLVLTLLSSLSSCTHTILHLSDLTGSKVTQMNFCLPDHSGQLG
jgi:hypothetical protein